MQLLVWRMPKYARGHFRRQQELSISELSATLPFDAVQFQQLKSSLSKQTMKAQRQQLYSPLLRERIEPPFPVINTRCR
jgi:hypothetical protein